MNIIGRLTRDAEVRTTSQEKQVVNFSVAVNDSYRNRQGEQVEQTTFFDCAYWISTNIARLLTKGTLVELTGRLSLRTWVGQNGEARSGLNFHTSHIRLHGGGRRDNPSQPEANAKTEDTGTTQYLSAEDDLPF